MIERHKSRFRWLENLTPPRRWKEEFLVSHPVYKGRETEVIWINRGRFRMNEEAETEFELLGDATFYRSLARALLYIAEGMDRLVVLDKHVANKGLAWYPLHNPVSRNAVIAHHTLQLKRSDAPLLWRGSQSLRECTWSRDLWDANIKNWSPDCPDVRPSRDTVFLTASAPIFVELARIAVAMSRHPYHDHYRTYALERHFMRSDRRPMLSLLKTGKVPTHN